MGTGVEISPLVCDLLLSRSLPLGFGVDLGYAFTYNQSTIENFVDNRNYTKHLVTLAGTYSF